MSRALVPLLLVLLPCVAGAETLVYLPGGCENAGRARSDQALLACFAPGFVAPDAERPHNRIGTPELHAGGWLRGERASVNPDAPALYAELRRELIGGRPVLQLVYRIHFERTPLSFSTSFYEAHRNPGLLVVVTLDERERVPLFVTTVHTCGCYRAVLPTEHVPRAVLPAVWPSDGLPVYGEHLPARVAAPEPGHTRLWLALRPERHRVAGVETLATPPAGAIRELPLRAMSELRALPLIGGSDGKRSSFFYEHGPLRGHVKGAWNPLEGLTLLGLVSLDPTVGMDKDFGDPERTGTPFYTMLRFWKQNASRLDRFERLLRELGFQPAALADGSRV